MNIKNITYFGLFPSPLYSSFLDRQIDEEEKFLIMQLSKNTQKNLFNNLTIENDVLNIKQFKNIKSFIQENLKIYLKNVIYPKNNIETFDIEAEEYNLYNSSDWIYPVKNNQLIIFPSYLRHKVKKNIENKTRISLSFNVFLKGEISKVKGCSLKI